MRNTLLIITNSEDETATYIERESQNIGSVIRVNTDNLYSNQIVFKNNEIIINSTRIEDICSIYYRKPKIPINIMNAPHEFKQIAFNDMINFIHAVTESFAGRCLTKPSLLRISENKAYVTYLASKIGLLVPKFIFSYNKLELNDFIASNQCITKSISNLSSNTTSIKTFPCSDMVDNIYSELISPIFLQEKIDKDYEIRIIFVNKEFLAVKLESSITYSDIKLVPESEINVKKIILPHQITESCLKLIMSLGLDFAILDFVVHENKYYFLEINPNGQWLELEKKLRLGISNKILEFLFGK